MRSIFSKLLNSNQFFCVKKNTKKGDKKRKDKERMELEKEENNIGKVTLHDLLQCFE